MSVQRATVLVAYALLVQMGHLPLWDTTSRTTTSRWTATMPAVPPRPPITTRRVLPSLAAAMDITPQQEAESDMRATEAGMSPEQNDITHLESYAVRLGDGTLLHRKRLSIGNQTGHRRAIARAVEMVDENSQVMDLRWIEADAHLLVNIDPEGGDLQVWMTRLEVCEAAEDIVRHFFHWYNGFDEHCRDTCCVKEELLNDKFTQGLLNHIGEARHPNQCAVMDKGVAESQVWVGLYRNHWACPAGMRPRKLSLVGRDESCCDFYKDPDANNRVDRCGRTDCTKGLDVGYCDQVPVDQDDGRILHDTIAGARVDGGDGPEESPCYAQGDELGCKAGDHEGRLEALQQNLKPGADDTCAWCILVDKTTGRPASKESLLSEDIHMGKPGECQVCSRVPVMLQTRATKLMANNLKWQCHSFYYEDTRFDPPRLYPPPCGLNRGGGGTGLERYRRDDEPKEPFHQGGFGRLSMQQPMDPATDAVFDRSTSHVPNYMSRGQAPGTEPAAARDVSRAATSGGLDSACPVTRITLAASEDPAQKKSATPGSLLDAKGDLESLMESVLGAGLGVEDVESTIYPVLKASGKLKQPSRMPFRSATQHFFSESYDGRAKYAVMGCPGGDMGQLIVALMVLEQNMGNGESGYRLGNTEVDNFLQDYLLHMAQPDPKLGPAAGAKSRLYMATDSETLVNWGNAVGIKNPMQPNGHAEAGRLVEAAGVPEHVGSPHLRMMLMYPERYGLRRALLSDLIRAYLRIMYDESHPSRGRLLFVANTGPWNPKGVIYVDRTDDYPCGETSCLVVPQSPTGEQYFVIHRAAASLYRETLANFVADRLKRPSASGDLKSQMDEMAETHMIESTTILAQGVGELGDVGARAGVSPGPDLPAFVASYSAVNMATRRLRRR